MSITDTARTLYQDRSTDTYECSPSSCGYSGSLHCQNCGYGAGESL